MKLFLIAAVCGVLVLIFTQQVHAQPAPSKAQTHWVASGEQDGWYYLMEGTKQIGAYHPQKGYQKLLSTNPKKWAEPVNTAPLEFPEPLNFGIDAGQLGKGPGYSINGEEVSKEAAYQKLIETDKLQDDSLKLRFVIIGQPSETKKVLDTIASSDKLKGLLKGVIIQEYPPDHWHVTEVGYKTDGKPTMYFVQPLANKPGKGKVLLREDVFTGPEQLEQMTAEAIRKADPSYNPVNDPNLDQSKKNVIDTVIDILKEISLPAWVLIGAVVLFFMQRNKEQK